MQTAELIQTLGYADSPRFLREEDLGQVPQCAHLFRHAFHDCGVRGVYLLRDDGEQTAAPAIYVAEAGSASQADEFHCKVWNQNIVPFLLVRTPADVRLYSGFRYRPADEATPPEERGVLAASVAFNEVLERLADLRADAIDDGTLWRTRGEQLDPTTRVDWRLLGNLKALGKWLRIDTGLAPRVAHALIGKFVYLRYLRNRNILSNRKLAALGVDVQAAFGRSATRAGVQALIEKVDDWLNGSVFPFPFSGKAAPTDEHVRRVAGVFLGDNPESGQLHLDFRAYDFSFIPIETLSVIYEQFLSAEEQNREKGAYYTPVHLVNFMLGELDGMRRLEPGRTVLDPSCGSGAFLVQCYRRLVERHFAGGGTRRPSELRDLLVKSIFGVDRDADACQVTGLSLLLAMLDYIDPPDLQSTPQFKLPDLVGENIFEGDFFDPESTWAARQGARKYDWIVGNPPWIQAGKNGAQKQDAHARQWLDAHAATHPVTNNDVAEAFAWKAMEHVTAEGAVGLLLPAMTLFKDSAAFRARYFTENDVWAVANFTNFRRDLFVKAETPAAALFTWGARKPGAEERDTVAVFSPLVANQATNQTRPESRRAPWVITVNSSELQQVSRAAIRNGDMLPWKVAMWGGPRDMHLLRSLREMPTLAAFVKKHALAISEGLQLREQAGSREAVEAVTEVAGELELNINTLKGEGRIYAFPSNAFAIVSPERAFVRRRGGVRLPLSVCRPPHVIVSGARTFATFSADFVVVPPRQIGIAGAPHQAPLLKALALYLNSDFAAYDEFFTSPQGGVREGRSTLDALKGIPTPLDTLATGDIKSWAKLYDELATTQQKIWRAVVRRDLPGRVVDTTALEARISELEAEVNAAVAMLLGLTDEEQVLVRDLVHIRRELADGLVPTEVVRTPEKHELEAYARRLERTLDQAIDDGEGRRHEVGVVVDGASGMVHIELVPIKPRAARSHVIDASEPAAKALAKIRQRMQQERGQWLYFDRNLFLFDGPHTYILKPLQRLWWTECQALADADYLVAEAIAPAESDAQ
jgi:hypothetical protein